MSFSFIFVSSCFFLSFFLFFLWLILFSYFSPFLPSFFNTPLNFFLLDLIKIINSYRFLLTDIWFFSYVFVVLRIFSQRTLQLLFVFVCFENYVTVAFQIETTFLRRAVNFWENAGINVLKNAFVVGQVIS